MKGIFSVAMVLGTVVALHAQGTFNPATYNSDPNFDHSGGTVTAYGVRVFGTDYSGQYYIGPAGTTDPNALTAVGPISGFMGTSASDPTAGYYNGDGSGSVTVPGMPGGFAAVVQFRAWKTGTSYDLASIKGASQLLTITLGNAGSPPSLPTAITGLGNMELVSPEPATILLGLMGAGAFFIHRRK